MNFADLQSSWRSASNQPSTYELDLMKSNLALELKRRRRTTFVLTSSVVAVLIFLTLRFTLFALGLTGSDTPFDLSREWASVVALGVVWVGAGYLIRRSVRAIATPLNPSISIQESVRALLDENQASTRRLKLVACLHGAMLLLLPLIVFQLRSVGKAGDEVLVPAFVLWPVLSVGILFAMRHHYRRQLEPRRIELEALLKQYSASV